MTVTSELKFFCYRAASLVFLLLLSISLLAFSPVYAENKLQNAPFEIKMPDEKRTLATDVPNVRLFDSQGRDFFLKDFIAEKPLVVSLIYTRCITTCLTITDNLKGVVPKIGGLGEDFNILTLSFDPRDTTHDLGKFRRQWKLNGTSWKVASGDESELKKFLETIDFHYSFDNITGEIIHPNFLVLLTPGGKISKYLYGVLPRENNLKLGIIEAKQGSSSFSALDGFLLQCYTYDPATGSYKLDYAFILEIVLGALTIFTIFAVVFGKDVYSFLFRRKDFHPTSQPKGT